KLVPFGGRELSQQRMNLVGERRRSDGLRQQPEPCPLVGYELQPKLIHCREERAPTSNSPIADGHLRAVRIVEAEHRSLRKDIGSPKAGGMTGIPLHLRGAAHVAFHQQPRAYTTERHGG